MTLRHETIDERTEWFDTEEFAQLKELLLERARRFDKKADDWLDDEYRVSFQIDDVWAEAHLLDSYMNDGSLDGFNIDISLYKGEDPQGRYCPHNYTDQVWTDNMGELVGRINQGFDLLEEKYPEAVSTLTDEQKAVAKRIDKYVAGFMEKLGQGQIPFPSGGDCWFCAMRTDTGESLGETTNDTSHLVSHMSERYYVPSLLMRALERYPASPVAMALLQKWMSGEKKADGRDDMFVDQIAGSLRSYMTDQLVREGK